MVNSAAQCFGDGASGFGAVSCSWSLESSTMQSETGQEEELDCKLKVNTHQQLTPLILAPSLKASSPAGEKVFKYRGLLEMFYVQIMDIDFK